MGAGGGLLDRAPQIAGPRGSGGRPGEWVLDYVVGNPQPAPVTTIAWRAPHIAGVNYLYWDYAFGTASMTFDLDFPGNGAAAAQWLLDSQRPLIGSLAGLTDADPDAPTLANWGEQWPAYKIFTTLIKQQVHHGAEISLLRDLYRNRETLHG